MLDSLEGIFMSLQAMANVVDRAPERGAEYQLLLSLANRADNAGRGIWFDLERIAFEARMEIRSAQRVLERLIGSGRVALELGAGPQGVDLLHLHLPGEKLTRAAWYALQGKAPASRRTPKGRQATPRQRRAASSAQKIEPGLKTDCEYSGNLHAKYTFLPFTLGLKTDCGYAELDYKYSENTLEYRPGAGFSAAYCPCTGPLKEIVIHVASEGDQAEPAGASMLARLLDLAKLDHWEGASPQKDQPPVAEDAWDDDDEALFGPPSGGPAVDEAAPDGAGRPVEVCTPLRNEDSGDAEGENAAVLEEVPPAAPALAGPADEADLPLWDTPEHVAPAARPQRAAPGSPVYDRLTALCGGSVRAPNLPRLLTEQTRAEGPRGAWLALSLPEIEDAVVAAKARVARSAEGLVFRTALIDALDALVDGTPLDTAPVPKGKPGRPLWDQMPRPGDGDTTPQKLTYAEGQRVRKGERLGVVKFASADARQAVITVDFDDGERELFTDQQARNILRDVLERDTPPPPAHSLVGSCWLHTATGKVLTVTGVFAGKPTTDDGTTWPAFGRDTLDKHATRTRTETQGAEGAA